VGCSIGKGEEGIMSKEKLMGPGSAEIMKKKKLAVWVG